MTFNIGPYRITGHQGLAMEKLRARVTTGSTQPILKPRSGRVCTTLPRINVERANAQRSRADSITEPLQSGDDVTVFPKWKPQDRFILSLDGGPNRFGGTTAAAHVIDHAIPAANLFYEPLVASDDARMPMRGKGTEMGRDSLSALTPAHRLDIFARRSNAVSVANKAPYALAQLLHSAGLRSVGVLKIHADETGSGPYLEHLKEELANLGITVGYLSGYKCFVHDMRIPVSLAQDQLRFNLNPLRYISPFRILSKKSAGPAPGAALYPEHLALKVVKGNIDIAFPGTRYSYAEEVAFPDQGLHPLNHPCIELI